SDFLLLEEADSFLGLADDPDCPAYNPEGDILILEAILNSEPPLPPPSQGTYVTPLSDERHHFIIMASYQSKKKA
ncbi:hypothetical protein Tco_0640957, partial [Tanacetum coccineum]